MSSRDEILRSIRRELPQATALPELTGEWIRFDDPIAQFGEVLTAIGGTLHLVETPKEIAPLLSDKMITGKRIISGVPGVLETVFPFDSIQDPHDLDDVELAILPGEVAVAENAAIWVQTNSLIQRTLYFICQHLALVVPRDQIVNNLPEFYERVNTSRDSFGCLISGPSKTADIEQSLVKGAHGARTLNVFLVAHP